MNMQVGSTSRARLVFATRPWPFSLLLLFALIAPQAHAGPTVPEEPLEALPVDRESKLPNLVPYPPAGIRIDKVEGYPSTPPYAVRFSVTIANRGQVPLDFKSEESPDDENVVIAAQCVHWIARKLCNRRYPAGEFLYHEAHRHYHIRDFALYELRSVTEDRQPDMAPEGLVAGGEKISFCVQDVGDDDPSNPLQPENPVYDFCLQGRQGISPGWSDTYDSLLPGQQIVLPPNIADGTYALVVTTDPTDRFYERPRSDNTAHTLVRIEQGGAVGYEVYGDGS